MTSAEKEITDRLRRLEEHLRNENPLMVDAVQSFRRLDRIAYRMGLLDRDHSYATQIAWWPLVSVLGTFSAGKSTFINHYLKYPLQATGTQAVDEKFTVICYTKEERDRVLPGIALNADPRFPFYKISQELEKVGAGEGSRVDAYLRLKTCPSDLLRGNIFIDSPGFDADAQRTATLRITNHIIDLSDLVLVFFDARHPEPGAMQDTLTHLVANTMSHRDSTKFLYILNQIDTTAREDNLEDVVAAWQRAIAQQGLTAGRFYCIYVPEAAIPIQDVAVRRRFESRRDVQLAEVHDRIQQVSVERAYRIVGALEKTARQIQEETVPRLQGLIRRWRRGVLWRDAAVFGPVLVCLAALTIGAGYWPGVLPALPALGVAAQDPWIAITGTALVLALAGWIHFSARKRAANAVIKFLKHSLPQGPERDNFCRTFLRNTRPWRSIFARNPVGWGARSRKELRSVIADVDRYVQALNDRYTSPSGEPRAREAAPSAPSMPLTASVDAGAAPSGPSSVAPHAPVQPMGNREEEST